MDINLTSPIVANINLIQPWWIPILNASSGLIGALIGAGSALYASYLIRELDERTYERERRIKSLNERKRAFKKSLSALSIMTVSKTDANPRDLAELILIGDKQIDDIFSEFAKSKGDDPTKWSKDDYNDLLTKLIVAMRDNVKGIEQEIADLQSVRKEHWWQLKR